MNAGGSDAAGEGGAGPKLVGRNSAAPSEKVPGLGTPPRDALG